MLKFIILGNFGGGGKTTIGLNFLCQNNVLSKGYLHAALWRRGQPKFTLHGPKRIMVRSVLRYLKVDQISYPFGGIVRKA